MEKQIISTSKFTKEELPEDLFNLLYHPETLNKLNENFKQEREECAKIIDQIRSEKLKNNSHD
jgi:hypothetical protein